MEIMVTAALPRPTTGINLAIRAAEPADKFG